MKTTQALAQQAGLTGLALTALPELHAFAALVAERCAEIVLTNGLSGPPDYTDYLEPREPLAKAILAEFPKP